MTELQRGPTLRVGLAFLTALLVALAARRAVADDGNQAVPGTDTTVEARRDFDEGLRRFNAGEYPAAIALFEASYRQSHAPGLLYNLAQAHRLNGDCSRALVFYLRYLATEPTGSSRARTQTRVADMERCLRDHDPRAVPPASADPDNEKAMPAGPPSPSPHDEASAPQKKELALSPSARLVAAPAAPATGGLASRPTSRTDEPQEPPITRRWWFWTVIATVAVGAAVATAAATGALNRDADCPSGYRCM